LCGKKKRGGGKELFKEKESSRPHDAKKGGEGGKKGVHPWNRFPLGKRKEKGEGKIARERKGNALSFLDEERRRRGERKERKALLFLFLGKKEKRREEGLVPRGEEKAR